MVQRKTLFASGFAPLWGPCYWPGMILGSLFRRGPKPGDKILVAYASQTGAAERIAWLTANALTANASAGGGFVRVAALGGLTVADLAEAGTLLVVTSTYGAGDAPDNARSFVKKQMSQSPVLKGLNFAVLALGDMKYDATFCGFGKSLDRWLARAGARRLADIICVDGDNDIAAMTAWSDQLARLGGNANAQALMPGPPQDWLLVERRLLNPGSPGGAGGEAWHIALEPKTPAHLSWTAGDIAEIWPSNPAAAVEAFLAAQGLDGTRRFRWQGHEMSLRDIIAHSHLPKPHEVEGVSVDWLVQRLEPFPHREYSIASLPQSGRMELLVRKAVRSDGTLGLGSGWLTQDAALGGVVKLRLRPNANFHAPGDGPMILIGAGTGIAGLRPHLLHRQRKGLKDAWLLFGERTAAADLHYGDDIRAWQADGTLTRADLVFSRAPEGGRYVQAVVAEQGDDIRAWVARGASLMVCGGLEMAAGVQDALTAILGEEALDAMGDTGLYRRDIY